jgi:hypothetical protein
VLLNTLSPAVHKFSYSIKKLLWLIADPVMIRLGHFIIIYKSEASESLLQGSRQMEIRRYKVWSVWWVIESFQFQML